MLIAEPADVEDEDMALGSDGLGAGMDLEAKPPKKMGASAKAKMEASLSHPRLA